MTIYALVRDDTVTALGLPDSARRLDSGEWVLGLANAPENLKAACGYLPIKPTPTPEAKNDGIIERRIAIIDGAPVEEYIERPASDTERAARTAEQNGTTLRAAARTALDTNAQYLAIGTPSAAQIATQVRALTRQTSALIRLVLNELQSA